MKHKKQTIMRFILIIIGNILIAFSISTLLLENNIIAGGVSGIGIVLHHYFQLPIAFTVGCINVLLFLLGLIVMGKVFVMTSLISTFLFPLLLEFFENHAFFHGYLNDPLLACILAGCFIGIGIGLILKSNASTGGVDILAIVLHEKMNLPVALVLNCIDISVLVLQMTYNDPTHVIYGIVSVMLSSYMLNQTLIRGTSLIQLVVISDAYQEIKNSILHDLDAGATLLTSEKGYTNQASKLVLSIVPYRKLPLIKEKINQIDPYAFIVVSHVDEVGGKGFTFEKRTI